MESDCVTVIDQGDCKREKTASEVIKGGAIMMHSVDGGKCE